MGYWVGDWRDWEDWEALESRGGGWGAEIVNKISPVLHMNPHSLPEWILAMVQF